MTGSDVGSADASALVTGDGVVAVVVAAAFVPDGSTASSVCTVAAQPERRSARPSPIDRVFIRTRDDPAEPFGSDAPRRTVWAYDRAMTKTVDVKLMRTEALCPACEHPLDRVPGVVRLVGVVAGCFGCGGVWIDNLAGRQLLEFAAPAVVRALLDALPQVAPLTEAQLDDYRTNARNKRRCPVCRESLSEQTLGQYGIAVDLCDAHGTFFDAQELLPVLRRLRPMSPAMERALQEEADRVRDAATPLEVALLDVYMAENDPRRRR